MQAKLQAAEQSLISAARAVRDALIESRGYPHSAELSRMLTGLNFTLSGAEYHFAAAVAEVRRVVAAADAAMDKQVSKLREAKNAGT